jgi:hypothetical protein
VISYRLWQEQFSGSTTILGRDIKVNGVSLKIVGVAPSGFNGDVAGDSAALWAPTMMLPAVGLACDKAGSLDCSVFDRFVGRLAPGHTRQEAQAEIATRIAWSPTEAVKSSRQRQVYVFPATGVDPDNAVLLSTQMQLLMSAAGTLLLIACANLAGLFLARGVNRKKEIAVRLSIGASRRRIIRQLMTESLLLALAGTGLGILLASWGRDILGRFYSANSEGFGFLYDLSFDWRVVGFSAACCNQRRAIRTRSRAYRVPTGSDYRAERRRRLSKWAPSPLAAPISRVRTGRFIPGAVGIGGTTRAKQPHGRKRNELRPASRRLDAPAS